MRGSHHLKYLKEFGKNYYNDLAYYNFEENIEPASIFEKSLKVLNLIKSL